MKERYWEATTKASNEITEPWYKKPEFWIGIIANVIALGTLVVARSLHPSIMALCSQYDIGFKEVPQSK